MVAALYSHASASFCCPHRVKEWEAAEKALQPAFLPSCQFNFECAFANQFPGFGADREMEEG